MPPLTPLSVPCANNTHTTRKKDTELTVPDHKFKLLNLPKFDKNGNIQTFIRLFEMSMRGASDHMKATTLINTLDPTCVDVIMPCLPLGSWTYEDARQAVIKEFGSETRLQA